MRRMIILYCLLLSALGLPLSAWAGCAPTPNMAGAMQAYPGRDKVYAGNNLVRSAGKPVAAEGQMVVVQGRLTDARCNPVEGAVIDLWQTNRDGIYQYADRAAMATPYALFTGSGRTTTDNAGRFRFVTIFPGAYADPKGPRAPHVNLLVRHAAFKPLATELFFEDDQRNEQDPTFAALAPEMRPAVTLRVDPQGAELAASVDLALPGTEPYKQ